MFGRSKVDKKLKKSLADRRRWWAEQDEELERYCRFGDGEGPRFQVMSEPPDPWQLALRSLRPRRKYEQNDD